MRYKYSLLAAFFLLLNGCMTQAPIKTVSEVNLKAFIRAMVCYWPYSNLY